MTLEAVKGVDTDKSGGASMKELMKALEEHGFPDINDLFVEKDGRLSLRSLLGLKKEVPCPKKVWEHFDKNGDGSWSLAEAEAAFQGTMKYFGHALPDGWKEEVAKHFKHADESGDGQVTPQEMGAYLFDMVDSNDDGEIQLSEVHDAIEAIAEFTKNTLKRDWKKMVDDALSFVDTDKSGGASMKEIMAALHEHGVPNINDLFE
jgi:Ca2+-binding EF-hand superfamily protein